MIGEFIYLLDQGLKILKKFKDIGFYYGDFKPANFLVTFQEKKLKLGDFGVSFLLQEENLLKGLTRHFSLPKIVAKLKNFDFLTAQELHQNDLHAFVLTFDMVLNR